jgi:small-conductance mechanosensitive channel
MMGQSLDGAAVGQTVRTFFSTTLFEIGGSPVTIASLVTVLLILVGTAWISRIIQRLVGRALRRSGVTEEGTITTILRLMHYVVLIAGGAVALQLIGISLTSVFAAGAVVAVGVGFALQNILQNFASGVILLAERSIKERDILEVDGEMILVETIGTRATVARSRDDDQLIIPNTLLVQSTVTNYTMSDDTHRVRATVGVTYSSDMAQVEQVLLDAAASVPGRIKRRPPVALLLEFGDSSVVWEVSVWTSDPWSSRLVRSNLNKAIWNSLKENGITIAFPQLDVHFDPGIGMR